ncbi:MAG: YadA-like family protein, partial [Candidatus Dadabacteria bacterium]|nr:YadA-like family protein [Candidatus Dadabacteria bacterium]
NGAIAIGAAAVASGEDAIAIGRGVTAGAGQVRIGDSSIDDAQIGVFNLGQLRSGVSAANMAIGSFGDAPTDRGSLHARINEVRNTVVSSINSSGGLGEAGVRIIIQGEATNGSIAGAITTSLYGDPASLDPSVRSARTAPAHADSVVGQAQRGILRSAAHNAAGVDTNGDFEGNGGYRRAPITGAGSHAPNSAANRRIVVQDTNQDGTVILSTLPLESMEVRALDRRVGRLEEDIAGVSAGVAMAMAMQATALPGKRVNVSFGAASYNKEFATAAALGFRVNENLHINTGAGWATSGSQFGVRGGFTIGW